MTQRVSFGARRITTYALVGFVGGVVVLATLKSAHQSGNAAFAKRIFPEMVRPASNHDSRR